MFRAEAFKNAYKLSGYSKLPPSPDAIQQYQFATKSLLRRWHAACC
jgi:hypothetical protein